MEHTKLSNGNGHRSWSAAPATAREEARRCCSINRGRASKEGQTQPEAGEAGLPILRQLTTSLRASSGGAIAAAGKCFAKRYGSARADQESQDQEVAAPPRDQGSGSKRARSLFLFHNQVFPITV